MMKDYIMLFFDLKGIKYFSKDQSPCNWRKQWVYNDMLLRKKFKILLQRSVDLSTVIRFSVPVKGTERPDIGPVDQTMGIKSIN
jgi:hypothetical protein